MADRKAELEKKKARLELMRKERQEKERQKKMHMKETDDGDKGKSQDLRTETEELLRNLGIPAVGEPVSPASSSGSATPSVVSRDSEVVSPAMTARPKSKVKLSVYKVSETNIAPREQVSYNKETQTANAEPIDKEALRAGGKSQHEEGEDTDSMEVGLDDHRHRMPHVEMVPPAVTAEDQQQKEIKLRELSEEEKKHIMMTEEFQSFVNRTSRVVERALSENVDIFVDYSGGDGEGKDEDQLAGERLKLNRDFYDERWSKHRAITSLDWSTQHPELLVAGYNVNEDAPHEPDGVALIWNVKYKKTTPEYVFHCQSPLMSCCFAKFHPNLVVGGTYSGQIVLWDNRVNKRTPVQRTPLSAAAHTHPVYCINVVGTQNAHNLISISTDGKICSWSLDMLSQPQDSMELHHSKGKAVSVTCFSFMSGDVNNYVVGAEDCTVYTGCRHGSKAGINEAFEGHQGPITSIDTHAVPGQIDFSPYFLTSSFDWTIKLWSIKDQKYLHSFEDNSDYVYCVQWSPIHPALFASVDGNGRLDLWNLNNETEVPTASVVVDSVALNQCRWHQSGHQIAAGDDNGKIYIYDVGEHIANPKSDEWSRFVRTLQELKQHAVEREEDSAMAGLGAPLR